MTGSFYIRFLFAYEYFVAQAPPACKRGFIFWRTRPIPCSIGRAIVSASSARVNHSICASLCNASEISAKLFASKKVEAPADCGRLSQKTFLM
jgi:hypothetical protein